MHQPQLPTNISILTQDRMPSTPSTLSAVIAIILPLLLVGSGECKPAPELCRHTAKGSGGADTRTVRTTEGAQDCWTMVNDQADQTNMIKQKLFIVYIKLYFYILQLLFMRSCIT